MALIVGLASRLTAHVPNLGCMTGVTGVACVLNMIDKRGEGNLAGAPRDPAGTIVICSCYVSERTPLPSANMYSTLYETKCHETRPRAHSSVQSSRDSPRITVTG